MGDPQLDEDMIIHMIQQPVTQLTLPYLQQAAMMVLTDLWDRKVTREEFGLSAGKATTMYTALAKLHVLMNVRTAIADNKLDYAMLDASMDKLHEIIGKRVIELVKVVEALQACPTSQDTVN